MARQLGYGGLANTNGARDFSGKAAAAPEVVLSTGGSWAKYHTRSRRMFPWILIGLELLKKVTHF